MNIDPLAYNDYRNIRLRKSTFAQYSRFCAEIIVLKMLLFKYGVLILLNGK